VSGDPWRTAHAFLLGLEIEEVYAIFGESIQIQMGGALQPAHYEQVERKAQRVRDFLLDFDAPFELVQRFEAVTAMIYRHGDPRAADLGRVHAESMEAAGRLSELMHEVRGRLSHDDAALYDLGVMLARLHLCLRVLAPTDGSPSPEFREVYAAELARVVPVVQGFLVAGLDAVARTGSEEFHERMRSLAREVDTWDGGSERWCRATRDRLERVLAAAGLLPRDADVPQSPANDAEAAVRALLEEREYARERFEARDLAGAEETQRALIEECGRRIGFDHPFTLAVRADLSFTLLALGEGDLAAEEAYALADDAERRFGGHDPNTARTQIHSLFVLMATRGPEECLDFYSSRLGWLARADPSSLDAELADVRRELDELTSGAGR
jgi:hypothetical protein